MKSPKEMSDTELIEYEKELNELVLTNPYGPYEIMRQDWLFEVRQELKIRESQGTVKLIYGKWTAKIDLT